MTTQGTATDDGAAVSPADLETKLVEARRKKAEVTPHDARPWGLAFSGGGIRSATFCLGLARALADHDVWRRFDYLSTVSGGGYIGSALGRLYTSNAGATEVTDGLKNDRSLFLWWLRQNGRFLLPAGAKDALRSGAGYLRGLLTTQFEVAILALFVSCVVMAPHLLMGSSDVGRRVGSFWISPWWSLFPIGALITAVVIFAYVFTRDRPGRVRPVVDGAAALLALVVAVFAGHDLYKALRHDAFVANAFSFLLIGTVALGFAMVAGWLLHLFLRREHGPREARVEWTSALAWVIAATVVVAVIGAADLLSWIAATRLERLRTTLVAGGAGLATFVVVVRAVIPALQKLAKDMGLPASAEQIANAAGLLITAAILLFWLVAAQWLVYFWPHKELSVSICETISGLSAQSVDCWSDNTYIIGRWIGLATICFLYMLFSGGNAEYLNSASLVQFYRSRLARAYVSVGNAPVSEKLNEKASDKSRLDNRRTQTRFPASPLGTMTEQHIEGLRDVTSFIQGDDVTLARYAPHKFGGPIHLVNCCINQTVDDKSGAYNADRKGVALTVSSLGQEIGTARPIALPDGDSDLSQWIAISGAAVGSGMGSFTKPGIAALSFLTGVRLGYWWSPGRLYRPFSKYVATLREWFGHFARDHHRAIYLSDGGHFENTGVYALLKREPSFILCADCGADPNYVFQDVENLVRKARIDYGASIEILDPKSFAENPLLAPIHGKFGSPDTISQRPGSQYLLVARVTYAKTTEAASKKTGVLLIVKPRRIASLSIDVAGYSDRDTKFPQQSTGDQFFDEAQWDSYCELGRALGSVLSQKVIDALLEMEPDAKVIESMGFHKDPEEKEPETTGARRERFSANVGKTLGAGAALSLLVGVWQTWQDARSSAIDARADQETAIKAILSGSAGGGDVLMRIKSDAKATVEGIVSSLEQIGTLHGAAAMEAARAKVAEGVMLRCVMGANDLSEADAPKCTEALAVLTTRRIGGSFKDLDRYWHALIAEPVDKKDYCRSFRDADYRSYIVAYEGSAPDPTFREAIRQVARRAGVRYIEGSELNARDSLRMGQFEVKAPAFLSSSADNECADRFKEQLERAPFSLRRDLPMFGYSAGAMFIWLPQIGQLLPAGADPKNVPVAVAALAPVALGDAQGADETFTVYVQFQGSYSRGKINTFREALRNKGQEGGAKVSYIVPAADRRGGMFASGVRYFNAADQAAATQVAAFANEYFSKEKCSINMPPTPELIDLKAPRGQIEVWVSIAQCQ